MQQERKQQDPSLNPDKKLRSRVAMVLAPLLLAACSASPHKSVDKRPTQPTTSLESPTFSTPEQRLNLVQQAAEEATKISSELNDSKDFPKGVPVPGILNGKVTFNSNVKGVQSTVTYNYPVILERNSSSSSLASFDGTWIGVPEHKQNHIFIQPMQINEAANENQSQLISLNSTNNPVFYGAAVYTTSSGRLPDQLIGFDITGNGNFPSIPISASAEK